MIVKRVGRREIMMRIRERKERRKTEKWERGERRREGKMNDVRIIEMMMMMGDLIKKRMKGNRTEEERERWR